MPLALLTCGWMTLVAAEPTTPAAIPLAGMWMVARTAVVQRPDDQPVTPLTDTGMSPVARAVVEGNLAGVEVEVHPVPGAWDGWGMVWRRTDGEVVYWRTVNVPDPGPGAWELDLGAIDDLDVTWINGVQVGSTDQSRPGYWTRPRRYQVPAGVLKSGENRIAVRVVDLIGNGGFLSPAADLVLKPLR